MTVPFFAAIGYRPRPMAEPGIDWRGQEWDDLVPRLLLLAMTRLRRMTWRGRRRESPPGAAEAGDFVNDAIAKTIAGLRVWNPQACTLFQHLAGVIVSDVSHAAASLENRSLVAADPAGESGAESWPPDVQDEAADPERVTTWRSERRRLLDHLAAVDGDLARMAELMLVRDLQETDDLAPALGIDAGEVANRRKRLKRAVRSYLLEQGA